MNLNQRQIVALGAAATFAAGFVSWCFLIKGSADNNSAQEQGRQIIERVARNTPATMEEPKGRNRAALSPSTSGSPGRVRDEPQDVRQSVKVRPPRGPEKPKPTKKPPAA